MGVTVSSALDTSVGLSAGAAAAAALPGPACAAGLGTAALLAADVTGRPLLPVDGHVPVGPVVPDPDLLARHAAAAERQAVVAGPAGPLPRAAAGRGAARDVEAGTRQERA